MIPAATWAEYGPWILSTLLIVVVGALWRELCAERNRTFVLSKEFRDTLFKLIGESNTALSQTTEGLRHLTEMSIVLQSKVDKLGGRRG